MELVCLILGPTPQPFSYTFWVLMSLHLLPFLLKMFSIILVQAYFACTYIYLVTFAHVADSYMYMYMYCIYMYMSKVQVHEISSFAIKSAILILKSM